LRDQKYSFSKECTVRPTPEEIDADLRSPDPDVRMAAGIAAVGDAWSSFRKASARSR
jgi:hypothetical protein